MLLIYCTASLPSCPRKAISVNRLDEPLGRGALLAAPYGPKAIPACNDVVGGRLAGDTSHRQVSYCFSLSSFRASSSAHHLRALCCRVRACDGDLSVFVSPLWAPCIDAADFRRTFGQKNPHTQPLRWVMRALQSDWTLPISHHRALVVDGFSVL